MLMAEGTRHPGGAGQRVLERRASREQSKLAGHAVGVDRPRDLPSRALVVQAPRNCPCDHGPRRRQYRGAPAQLRAPPGAGGYIGARVGVAARFDHTVRDVRGAPAPVRQLPGRQPVEGALDLSPASAGGEGHRRFDMVPRVGVAPCVPGDHPVRQLHGGYPIGGLADLVRGQRGHCSMGVAGPFCSLGVRSWGLRA